MATESVSGGTLGEARSALGLPEAVPVARPATQPLIELHGTGVQHPGRGYPVLSAINLSVRHGELVTLTGPAGSGKSTLLSVVGLLLRPTTGRYLLNGLDTARLSDRERTALRCRMIGRVFQRPQLLASRSVLDNVMLPVLYAGLNRQQRAGAATVALERVGLATRAGVTAGELSAGEQQRVAMARAITADPSLVLCDDPTAGLDQMSAAEIIGFLVSLHKEGTTVLIATRDQLAAAHSSHSIVLGTAGVGMGLGRGP
jgi:putative ABC transport system ATP-binding protein